MQICEYFFENACYSVTKYYLCKQNNKRSLLGRKQRHQVVRSFPNRYLFSLTNKLTFLFPISCILEIILHCNNAMYSDVVFIFFLQVGFRKYTIYFSSDKNFSLKNLLKASPLSPSLFPSTPPVHVPPPVTAAD